MRHEYTILAVVLLVGVVAMMGQQTITGNLSRPYYSSNQGWQKLDTTAHEKQYDASIPMPAAPLVKSSPVCCKTKYIAEAGYVSCPPNDEMLDICRGMKSPPCYGDEVECLWTD